MLSRFMRPRAPAGLRAPTLLPGGAPLLGHTVEFVRSPIDLLRRARAAGDVVGLRVAGLRMAACFGPAANEAVLRAPDEVLSPAAAYRLMTPIFGEGMVYDAGPERMAAQIRMLLPALQDRRMRGYGETAVAEAQRFVASWGPRGEIELVEAARVLTFVVTTRCLLGRHLPGATTEELAHLFEDLGRAVHPLAMLAPHLPLPMFRRRDRARARIAALVDELVQRRRAGASEEDFLQALVEATYPDGTRLTGHEITGMVISTMFAGHHTTAVTLAWTIVELLRHPEMMERVIAELDTLSEAPSFAELRALEFTERAIKEALRLHSPTFMLARVAVDGTAIGGCWLAPGTWALVSPIVTHEDPRLYREPLKFDPDRFAPPRGEGRDYAFIAFAGGRHRCIGSAFASLIIKATLAVLLRRYRFAAVGDRVVADFAGLTVGPRAPVRLRYEPREARPAGERRVTPAASGCPFGAGARLVVDRERCRGHGSCVVEAPELFALDAEGKVRATETMPRGASLARAALAVKSCPSGAIALEPGQDPQD